MALSNGPNLGILVDGAIGEVHYDALMQQWRAMDALVQPRVKSATITTPPVTPSDGDCYIVPSGATGVWSSNTNKIARYSSKQTAWEYYTPKNGWVVHNEATSSFIKFNGTVWVDPIINKADLVDGKVPASQLPSYVDDILEFPNLASFPVTGESGKIYVAIDTGNGYRWSGSTYVKVSQPLEEMPQAVAEAGTSETLYAATARRIRQAIAAWWLTASSAFGRTLANVGDAAAGRTALGLGTAAVVDASVTPEPMAIPRAGADGRIDSSWIRQSANDIGTAGSQGFGVGICPAPPAGMSRLAGTLDVASANYGNYQYSDGSIMVWVPAFFYKWGTGANGLAINNVAIKPRHAFASVADANAAGFALHRAFYDGGAEKSGFFVDKYLWSNNGGVASSIAAANPISSAADHNPFSGLNGAPTNAFHGAIVAAKTRGADFFCSSRFIFSALALLSYAHAAAAKSTNYCAWFDAVANFPKGNNNNALRDANDAGVLYTSTGHATYPNCGKTGSGSPFAKTTHNGQACGVADLNGNMWEITPGITSDGTNFFILNPSVAMKNVTAGTTLATDLWGATGIAAMYDSLGATFESLTASSTAKLFGSASQVFSEAVAGNEWTATGAGIPLAGGTGGSNAFGNDGLWDYRPNQLCPISGGSWSHGASAGVWALDLRSTRATSYTTAGGRSALYL